MNKGVYIIATGGGSDAISKILTGGGASSYFIGEELPYNEAMFDAVVGGEVWDTKLVSERSAHQLAAAAYQKAKRCCDSPIGIGVSASLCKIEKERTGRENVAHVCVIYKTDSVNGVASTHYQQGYKNKNRSFQEQKLAMLIREVIESHLSDALNVPHTGYYPALYYGHRNTVIRTKFQDRKLMPVMSGSFNPMHAGHIEVYTKAAEHFGVAPLLEIPIDHHSKPSISPFEFEYRSKQIATLIDKPIIVPGFNALYYDKQIQYQKLLPNVDIVFVMGRDVYQKISNKHRDHLKMLVFGRSFCIDFNGNAFDDHPNMIKHKMEIINQESSTAIRKAAKDKSSDYADKEVGTIIH